mmetsp:Transcript_5188/g.4767  ORF Transcript_5188/g.4767 Transcript_5188/m.4767 type:complete len:159 (+) Transcript_5188:1278-1754(+)
MLGQDTQDKHNGTNIQDSNGEEDEKLSGDRDDENKSDSNEDSFGSEGKVKDEDKGGVSQDGQPMNIYKKFKITKNSLSMLQGEENRDPMKKNIKDAEDFIENAFKENFRQLEKGNYQSEESRLEIVHFEDGRKNIRNMPQLSASKPQESGRTKAVKAY